MRIVLDTNVVVSALLWRGTPHQLREAIRQRPDTQLFASAALLEELREVLSRPMAANRLALIGRTAQQVLTDYVEAIDLVSPIATPAVVVADADNDHVIAAAVATRANLLISGDRHLLNLIRHGAITIVTPADAIRLIGGTG